MNSRIKMNLQHFADKEVPGILSFGTALFYRDGSKKKEIAAVKSIPAIGSDPEKVDVTHLKSPRKAYIKGLQDTDNLEFAIIHQGKNFADIHALVSAGRTLDWVIEYPLGMTATFKGIPDLKVDGAEVNSAIGFNLVVVVSEGPDMMPGTS